MTRALARAGLAAMLAGALAGCAVQPGPTCRLSASRMLSAALFFGLSSPAGPIDAASFARFAATEITPRFPGYTIVAGKGVWMGAPEAEQTVLIAAPDDAATDSALSAIRAAYRRQFQQRSVGLITTRSCADFGPG